MGALCGSGALCGLAGGLVVLGLRFYIAPGWAESWGFEGILVAFLAFRQPYLIPVWSVLFGMLAAAGPTLQADVSVPDSVVTVMQTLPVIALFLLYSCGRVWTLRRTTSPSPKEDDDIVDPVWASSGPGTASVAGEVGEV
jgi:simple sugar transport system permease protein